MTRSTSRIKAPDHSAPSHLRLEFIMTGKPQIYIIGVAHSRETEEESISVKLDEISPKRIIMEGGYVGLKLDSDKKIFKGFPKPREKAESLAAIKWAEKENIGCILADLEENLPEGTEEASMHHQREEAIANKIHQQVHYSPIVVFVGKEHSNGIKRILKSEYELDSNISKLQIIYNNMRKMRKNWPLGFLGFLFLLGIPGLLTRDWLDMLWLVWVVWFAYFIPEKILKSKRKFGRSIS